MTRPLIFLMTLFLLSYPAYGQLCIRGNVSGDSSGAGLAFAEIHLSGVNKNTFTDDKGSFSICGIPKGSFHLQVKQLGYKTYFILVNVNDSMEPLQVRMEPSVTEFPEIVV